VITARLELDGTVQPGERQLTNAPIADHQVDTLAAVQTRVRVTRVDLRLTVHPYAAHTQRRHFHTLFTREILARFKSLS